MDNTHTQQDMSLLIVEDDAPFSARLAKAMEKRGFQVATAASVQTAMAAIHVHAPAFAIVDMRLNDGNGLDVVKVLHELRADARVIVATGYGNIASAVNAVKLGAVDYIAKPTDADEIYAALMAQTPGVSAVPEVPMSADRVKWEHILRVYELCNHNISETARKLSMHRRTLQRILSKRAPK